MNLHQQLLLSLCHARFERAVKKATEQLLKEVDEALLRIASDDTMGAGDDRTHSQRPDCNDGVCERVDVARVVRDGSQRLRGLK